MLRFKFRLEAVLRHRTVIEDQKLRAFALVHTEMALVDERLAALRGDFDRTVGGRPRRIDVTDIGRRERYLDAVGAQIQQHERVREGIAARLEAARLELIAARQDREAVQRVHDNDYAAHVAAARREEQMSIDEIATMRYRSSR
jgi:flagellar export protein FliJ